MRIRMLTSDISVSVACKRRFYSHRDTADRGSLEDICARILLVDIPLARGTLDSRQLKFEKKEISRVSNFFHCRVSVAMSLQ